MNLESRNELPKYLRSLGLTVGAEIGVYEGDFAEKLCGAGLKLYAIDPWITYDNYRKDPREIDYEIMYENVKKRLAKYNCSIVRKTSMDAVKEIPNESLDFVYIDANHSYPYVAQDIYEWQKKVRKGGVVAGHDYFNTKHNPYWIRACHVKYVVDNFVEIFKVKLRVFGEKDNNKSWLWRKE